MLRQSHRFTDEKLKPCKIAVQDNLLTQEYDGRSPDLVFEESLRDLNTSRYYLGKQPDAKEAVWYGGMTIDAGKAQKSRHNKRSCSNENVERQEGQSKKRRTSGEAGIVEFRKAEYFSGDSDLTAEHMAEASSTSSLEDGCAVAGDDTPDRSCKGVANPERSGQCTGFPFPDTMDENVLKMQCRKPDSNTNFTRRDLEERRSFLQGHEDVAHESRNTTQDISNQRLSESKASSNSMVQMNAEAQEDEDDWLQLGLRSKFSHRHTMADPSGSDVTSSTPHPDKLAILQLLPQKPDCQSIRRREIPKSECFPYQSVKAPEEEKHISYIVPLAAPIRADDGAISTRMSFPTLMGTYQHVDALSHQPNTSYTSLLAGTNEFIANRRSFSSQEQTEKRNDIVSSRLPGYHHAPYQVPTNGILSETSVDDRSDKTTWLQDASLPRAAREWINEGRQYAANFKSLPTWPSFHDPRSNSADPSCCAINPGMASQQLSNTGGELPAPDDWPSILNRFSTNLRFQGSDKDFLLNDFPRVSPASFMPPHDLAFVQQAIGRYQSSIYQDMDKGNMVASGAPWLSRSLLRSHSEEQRMMSLGLAEITPIVGDRSQSERSFLHPNPLNRPANVGSRLAQRSLSETVSQVKRITKPQRGLPGFWFALQAAQTQRFGRALPQIPKCYIRIRDGGMPISVVKKYLVSKLGLSSESQVEITCRGKDVIENASLEDVRDEIWFSANFGKGDALSFRSAGANSSTLQEYVMVLTYQSSHHIQVDKQIC